ncbi:MAG TPA: triphosphoribosyl-dephospho-CoA synthase, partial [Gemmataceae bacterium]|nr:triphosphoribosyl-dephospho-CoA synthase [Gemmataceae bacterium]
MSPFSLPIDRYASVACLWEVTARKPGNVHRYRDFDDLTYLDFVTSAAAIAPGFEKAPYTKVGELIMWAVISTREVVRTNTNLGIILLLAPLAVVPARTKLRQGLPLLLDSLDVEDSQAVYEAIRLANPGGLGRVEDQDVNQAPTLPLREIMALAADRDLVARQYANGFREVFDDGVPALTRGLDVARCLEGAIIFCHLSLMAKHPDSLIARKRGTAEAEEASRRARAVLDAGWPQSPAGAEALSQLDDWLRAVGRGRNPGTTADLVTASLFVGLREQILTLPPSHPWTLDAGPR